MKTPFDGMKELKDRDLGLFTEDVDFGFAVGWMSLSLEDRMIAACRNGWDEDEHGSYFGYGACQVVVWERSLRNS